MTYLFTTVVLCLYLYCYVRPPNLKTSVSSVFKELAWQTIITITWWREWPWCEPRDAVGVRSQCTVVTHPKYFVGSLWAHPICQQEWIRTPARRTGSITWSVVTVCSMQKLTIPYLPLCPGLHHYKALYAAGAGYLVHLQYLLHVASAFPSPELSSLHLYMAYYGKVNLEARWHVAWIQRSTKAWPLVQSIAFQNKSFTQFVHLTIRV